MNAENRYGMAVGLSGDGMLPEFAPPFARVPPHLEVVTHTARSAADVLADLQPLLAEADRRDRELGGSGFQPDATCRRDGTVRVHLIPHCSDGAVERLRALFADRIAEWNLLVPTAERREFRLIRV